MKIDSLPRHPDESLPAMLLACVCALMWATALALACLS